MKDMTKPHPRGCCAAVWGCGHGPETPGWSRPGSFDLPWRDFSQIDVIAYVQRVSTSHLGGLTQKQKSIKTRFAGFLSEGVLVRKAR
jgi:hypothetical protein